MNMQLPCACKCFVLHPQTEETERDSKKREILHFLSAENLFLLHLIAPGMLMINHKSFQCH